MSVILPGWQIEQQAEAARHVSAIIAACVTEIDRQLPMLHALYEMRRDGQHAEVEMILDILEGAWV